MSDPRVESLDLQDGCGYACYADGTYIEDQRLDWLARHGMPNNITKNEIRIMAEELWQNRKANQMFRALREIDAGIEVENST